MWAVFAPAATARDQSARLPQRRDQAADQTSLRSCRTRGPSFGSSARSCSSRTANARRAVSSTSPRKSSPSSATMHRRVQAASQRHDGQPEPTSNSRHERRPYTTSRDLIPQQERKNCDCRITLPGAADRVPAAFTSSRPRRVHPRYWAVARVYGRRCAPHKYRRPWTVVDQQALS